jgi:hypothetical protein
VGKTLGARRLARGRMARLVSGIGHSPFTSKELEAACKRGRLKYDSVQRALLRMGLIKPIGLAVSETGELPRGAPERTYVSLVTTGEG